MSVNYNPATPADGLILCLDTANRRSYPGSGSTWFDISGGRNNGTLTNGPVLNTAIGGIAMDGVDDIVMINSISLQTNYSASIFARARTINIPTPAPFSFRSSTLITPVAFQVTFRNTGDFSCAVRDDAGTIASVSGGVSTINTWFHLCLVRRGNHIEFFVNGLIIGSSSASFGTITPNSLLVGAIDLGGPLGSLFDGFVDDVRLYNRALSQSEVYQLFSSKRGRFNI